MVLGENFFFKRVPLSNLRMSILFLLINDYMTIQVMWPMWSIFGLIWPGHIVHICRKASRLDFSIKKIKRGTSEVYSDLKLWILYIKLKRPNNFNNFNNFNCKKLKRPD